MKETASRVSLLKAILHALVRSDIAVALLFFALALAVRWYFAATHPYFNGLLSVRGVPYSDGQGWTLAAIELIHGHGLGNVFRPFYSIFLALFYVWTDWSFTTITCLNVLIGAFTAAFLYLTARLSFNRWIGFAAATFFTFDPSQIIKTPQAATEPLGLLLFILAVYFMLETGRPRTASAAILSGVFFGLSNLARPLTLFCAPAYTLLLAAFEWSRKNIRWAIIASLFTLGTCASMAPWLIRQKLVHNIWSVSTNMGEALYAATSPVYKKWTPLVRLDAERAGAWTLSERNSFYMQESVQHIRDHPTFYFSQTSRALWIFLNCFDSHYRAKSDEGRFRGRQPFTSLNEGQTVFIFVVLGLLLLAGLWKLKSDAFAGAIFLLLSAGLVGLWRVLPSSLNFLILSAGFVLGLISGKSKQNVSLLAASLLFTGVGNAVFNNAVLFRSVLMSDWLFACFYLAAFFYSASALTSALLRLERKSISAAEGPKSAPMVDPFVATFESRVKRALKILAILFLLFAAISATRLVLANLHSEKQPAAIAKLNASQKMKILQTLKTLSPSLEKSIPPFDEARLYVASRLSVTGGTTAKDLGPGPVTAVEPGIFPYFIHYFPKGTDFEIRGPIFRKRPFAYSMFRFANVDVIFRGRIPRELSGTPAIVVGKIELPKKKSSYDFPTLQCDAIIPLKRDNVEDLDYAHVMLPKAAPR
jgi:hypothetical protein